MTAASLLIRVLSRDGAPLAPPLEVRVTEAVASIGRAPENAVSLADPTRTISRRQVELRLMEGAVIVANVGTANPVLVNGRSLDPGERAGPVAQADLRIGHYALTLQVERAAPAEVIPEFTIAPKRAAASLADRLPDDFDPFADLSPPAAGAASDGGGAASPPVAPKAEAADPGHPMAAPVSAASTPATDDWAGLLKPSIAPGESLDALFGLDASGALPPDPLAALGRPVSAPGASAAPSTDAMGSADPLQFFGGPVPKLEIDLGAAAPVLRGPEIAAPFVPARPAPSAASAASQESAAPAPAGQPASAAQPAGVATERASMPSTPAVPATPVDPDALMRAFCAGAGLPVTDATMTPERMERIGALLAAAVHGMVTLMGVRAALKQEMRAEVTTIQARNNNPLKFAPDADAALAALLQPPVRGFLPGPLAMREAADDLVAHTVGTMAGLRAALAGLLQRLDPATLEQRLGARGALDALLPGHRKARLWELYLQHAAALRAEAEDDFHAAFGRAFVQAYEDQIDALERDRDARDGAGAGAR